MELIKLHEAYNLVDVKDNWMTGGTVTKEVDGTVNININTTLKAASSEESNQWGTAYYQRSAEGKVMTSYSFEGAYQAEYVNYCEEIFAAILEQIEK